MKKDLPTVTLLGVDCVDIERLAIAAEICLKDFNFADVRLLTSLPAKNIKNIVPIKPLETVEAYSKFIITELAGFVATEHVLLIQYDGFILNPGAWNDENLKYDYIGAPLQIKDWSIEAFKLEESTHGSLVVGNGGFSLRSKKLLNLLSEMNTKQQITEYHPEDVIICIKIKAELEARGIKFAPVEVAKQFSFEGLTAQNYQWNNEFGFHGLSWTDISKWINAHPEYNINNNFDIKKL